MKTLKQSLITLTAAALLAACGSAPKNPEPVAGVNSDAAPAAPATPAPDRELWVVLEESVYTSCKSLYLEEPTFRYDSARVRGADMPELTQLATCLTIGPLQGAQVELLGRTDPRGPADYNKELALDRAQAVKRFLVNQGVEPRRLVARSAGERGNRGLDAEDWDEARRVDVVLF